jgi:hypothetical protein
MPRRNPTRVSFTFVVVLHLAALVACGGSSPDAEKNVPRPEQATAQAGEPPASPAGLTGTRPAPGSERINPDEHPELAHLTEVTTDSLAQSITDYVSNETDRQNGVFPVEDPVQHTTLQLTLMNVHRERLSQLVDGRYFACADFKGRDGHTYDVDVLMQAQSSGLVPTDVIVHKQDGAPRFNWVENNGVWSQAPVTAR